MDISRTSSSNDSRTKLREVFRNRGRCDLDQILLRATPASNVCAGWSDVTLPRCRAFWQDARGRKEDYELSEDAESVDVFVSHSWSPPADWNIVMGPDVHYA